MAKDKQSTILVLTIINTLLLVMLAFYVTCPVAKKGCFIGKKDSGKICPISQKGSTTQAPDVPEAPAN